MGNSTPGTDHPIAGTAREIRQMDAARADTTIAALEKLLRQLDVADRLARDGSAGRSPSAWQLQNTLLRDCATQARDCARQAIAARRPGRR